MQPAWRESRSARSRLPGRQLLCPPLQRTAQHPRLSLSDRETEPRATTACHRRHRESIRGPIEEDTKAFATIPHSQRHRVRIQRHRIRRSAIATSVLEQIDQDPLKPARIRLHAEREWERDLGLG